MTVEEVINEITSEHKFYVGKMPQSTASNFLASYRKGMAKQKTIENFLEIFGYTIIKEAEWTKQLDGKPKKLKTK